MALRAWRTGAAAIVAVALLVTGVSHARAGVPWAWGSNGAGQLGDGTWTGSAVPVQTLGLSGVYRESGGFGHSIAVAIDGSVRTWGDNSHGQLGDGTTDWRNTPGQVSGIADIVGVSAGWYHSVVWTSLGNAYAWGSNAYSQCGDGTGTERYSPVAVLDLTGAVDIRSGEAHNLALRSDRTVWAWGYGGWGQLGTGDQYTQSRPVQVPGLNGIVAIACGGSHSLVLLSDGTVKAFGYNSSGRLGDGTNTHRSSPVGVLNLSGVVAIAAGANHSMALKGDGTVWTWGYNASGQLGDGTTTNRWTPVQVAGLTAVVAIAGGGAHSLAITSDGTVWAWGYNGYGQLGDGTGENRLTPVQVSSLTNARAITAGYRHSLCLARESPTDTSTQTLDRSGVITETVGLRAYLRRAADNAPLPDRTVWFSIDGTPVGAGMTNSDGRADVNWTISEGAAQRVINGRFAGDVTYDPSSQNATLTCQSWVTKMATFNRTGRITDRTELKARLLRSDNAPLYAKPINFYVDGTFIITRNTNVDGYASYPFYDIPDGAGAGVRTILSEWTGNGGYAAVSKTANLTVLKAIPYIWVLSKSVASGGIANLYAYFRRLYDYKKQEGKSVTFRIDGTWIADVTTGSGASEPGVARYLYPTTGLGLGVHKVRCEFAGDAWLDAGYGEGNLTIL